MRPLIAMFLAIAPMVLAQEAVDPPASAFRPDSSPKAAVRFTAGLGGGTFGFVGVARGLFGQPASDWRFGGQAMGMSELKLFTSPNEEVRSFHCLVGRELSPSGPFSAMLFAGAGMAASRRRGRLLENRMFDDTYESIHSADPSLLVGMDVGLSYRRHLGLSLQVGAQVSRVTAAYMTLQLDAGAW